MLADKRTDQALREALTNGHVGEEGAVYWCSKL